jgi:hypothetical protein
MSAPKRRAPIHPRRNVVIPGVGARSKRTLDNEEAILNIVEEDGTRSIREIAQELDISSRSVHRVNLY